MDRHFDEGVAGAALGVLFTTAGANILAHPPFVLSSELLAVSTLFLAGLEAAVGVGLVRLAARRRPAQPPLVGKLATGGTAAKGKLVREIGERRDGGRPDG